jgi:hypothetical protein
MEVDNFNKMAEIKNTLTPTLANAKERVADKPSRRVGSGKTNKEHIRGL